MNVSAVGVTRGDVDLGAIVGSLPREWERIFWSNGEGRCYVLEPGADPAQDETWTHWHAVDDLAVYGRYAAIEHATNDLIYVQDDDCVVSDPQALVDAWRVGSWHPNGRASVVCNMPANFRHAFYQEHSLVGFGAVFHRDAPKRAFARYGQRYLLDAQFHARLYAAANGEPAEFFHRTCDIIFTGLTPHVLVDVPYEDLPWASADNRMWRQPTHREERQRMLDLVRQVRDGN